MSERKPKTKKVNTIPSQTKSEPVEKYILKLYISGMTLRSRTAIQNIQSICARYLTGRCNLEIIDVFQQPALAKAAQIIAIPTLVKESPLPLHRIIGDLSKTDRVLSGLDIVSLS